MHAKAINVEIKRAGGDRHHPKVRSAIERARAVNMPNENIERAIASATGAGAADLTEVLYEAYGPGGSAILIEGITDNKNRTSQELKHLLSLYGSNLATPGSVTWAFKKTDLGWAPLSPLEITEVEAQQLADLLDALEENEDVKTVTTNVPDL